MSAITIFDEVLYKRRLRSFWLLRFILIFTDCTLLGIWRYTPFLNSIMAQSAWPLSEAMCISVLPSLVRSKMEALNLSANSSMMEACPFSAARCIGVRSVGEESWTNQRRDELGKGTFGMKNVLGDYEQPFYTV